MKDEIRSEMAGDISEHKKSDQRRAEEQQRKDHDTAKRLAQEMAIFANIGRLIGSSLNIDEVYESFAAQAMKLVPFDRLSVDLNNPDEATFTVTYVSGFDIPGRGPGDRAPIEGTISGHIFRTRKSLLISTAGIEETTSRFPHLTTIATVHAGMRSIVSVPLTSRDEVIGTLHFRSKKPNAYTKRDRRLAERIGAQIAGAIANAQLFTNLKKVEEEQRRNREEAERLAKEMAIIARIGWLISSTMDIEQIYEQFAAETRKLLPFDRLSVSLNNPHEYTQSIAYVSGYDTPMRRKGDTFSLEGTINEVILQTRTGLLVSSDNIEDLINRVPGIFTVTRANKRSVMAVPLISQDKIIGALHFRSKTKDIYTQEDLRLAERIGEQIAGAIANAQIYSKLKQTEESLRESERRFRTLVEEAAVGVAEVDVSTGQFITVNRRLCEMVDRTEEELLATTFIEITYPDDRHLREEKLKLLLAGEIDSYSLEKRCVRKNGELIWVHVTVSPLWKPGDKPGRNMTVVENITERRQAEEELIGYRKHLEDMVKERTDELETKNITLQELNTTLRVLLKQREEDKRDMEERFLMNIRNMVLPFMEQMKKGRLDSGQKSYLDIIETHLHTIATPLLKNMRRFNLTPKEVRVAVLVKEGKSTKEIAEILKISATSIDIHRRNIRKKLRLSDRKTNLQSHLAIFE